MQKTGAKNRIGIDKELYLIKSTLTAAQTVARLKHILEEKHIPINFVINHAQDAASVGLVLRPTFTVFAGSPQMRVRLLQVQQAVAVLLPLRISVWEDEKKQVWLGYLRVRDVAKRYGLTKLSEISYLENIMENISHRACHPGRTRVGKKTADKKEKDK